MPTRTTYTPAQLLARRDSPTVLKADGTFDVERHRAKPALTITVRGNNGEIQTITAPAVSGGVSAKSLSETTVTPGNPSDYGTAVDHSDRSLFGKPPVLQDTKQGQVKDCFLVSAIAAIAASHPEHIPSLVRDTKTGIAPLQARFTRGNNVTWVGTDATVDEWYTPFGASGVLYPIIMQKGYAYFRNGKNTIDDLNIGWSGDVFRDLGYTVMAVSPNDPTCVTTLMAWLAQTPENPNGQPVTMLSTPTGGTYFPEYHEMVLVACNPILGTNDAYITIYNQWQYDGGRVRDGNPSDGFVTCKLSDAMKEIQVFTTATNPTFPIVSVSTGDTPAKPSLPASNPGADPAIAPPTPVPPPPEPPQTPDPVEPPPPPAITPKPPLTPIPDPENEDPTPDPSSPTITPAPPETPPMTNIPIPLEDLLAHPKSTGGVLTNNGVRTFIAFKGTGSLSYVLPNDFQAGFYAFRLTTRTDKPRKVCVGIYVDGEKVHMVYGFPDQDELAFFAYFYKLRAGMTLRIEATDPGLLLYGAQLNPLNVGA